MLEEKTEEIYNSWQLKGSKMREYLNKIYVEFFNNYLTIEKFAEHNLLDLETARNILEAGRTINGEGVNFEHKPQAMTF